VVPVVKRVADYDKANPNKSTREAGEALGVSHMAVHNARSGVKQFTPGETTIDNPPKGAPWDDQNDRVNLTECLLANRIACPNRGHERFRYHH
jgi:hypothetical protein